MTQDAAAFGRDGDRHRRRDQPGRATITAAPGFAVVASDPSSACLVSVARRHAGRLAPRRDAHAGSRPDALGRVHHEWRPQPSPRARDRLPRRRRGRDLPARVGLRSRGRRQSVDHAARARRRSSTATAARARAPASRPRDRAPPCCVPHSAIVNNASDNDGGGIYLGGGWATNIIQRSTISGNTTSGVGGGVLVRFAAETNTYVHIFTSTIANNTAAGTGGGIEFEPADQVGYAGRVGVREHRGGQLLAVDRRSNGTSTRAGTPTAPAGVLQLHQRLVHLRRARAPAADRHGRVHVRRSQPVPGPAHADGRRRQPAAASRCSPAAPPSTRALDDTAARRAARRLDRQRRSGARPPTWTLFDPLVDGDGDGTAVRDLGAYERNDRWQTELLAVRAQGPVAAHASSRSRAATTAAPARRTPPRAPRTSS